MLIHQLYSDEEEQNLLLQDPCFTLEDEAVEKRSHYCRVAQAALGELVSSYQVNVAAVWSCTVLTKHPEVLKANNVIVTKCFQMQSDTNGFHLNYHYF